MLDSRLFLTLNNRSGEPKIDNGPSNASAPRDRQGRVPGRLSLGDERIFFKQRKGYEHELTDPRITSRKHHFWTDEFSAVVALGDTTGGACCWTPDAALAERARLADIGRPEYLVMEAIPYCAAMRVVAPASYSGPYKTCVPSTATDHIQRACRLLFTKGPAREPRLLPVCPGTPSPSDSRWRWTGPPWQWTDASFGSWNESWSKRP